LYFGMADLKMQYLLAVTNGGIDWWLIPKDCKEKIRSTLAQIGITDATLFPELDYQSRYLLQRWARTRERDEPDPLNRKSPEMEPGA
jgi:hypothetical protein